MAKPRSVVETLRQAKALIADRKSWIKYRYKSTSSNGTEKFCAIGALQKVDGRFEIAAKHLLRRVLRAKYPLCMYVENFNDSRQTRHKDVLALFNAAIKEAKYGRTGSIKG